MLVWNLIHLEIQPQQAHEGMHGPWDACVAVGFSRLAKKVQQ